MNLSDIPFIPPTKRPPPVEHVPWTPSSPDEPPQYEYEFSNYYGGVLHFVHLWDTTDISACERVCHRPLTQADITYSNTGNGFVKDKYDLEYTFKKSPYERSWRHTEISAGTELETDSREGEARNRRITRASSSPTADNILASL
jgi:hypothetical protein